MGSKRSEVEAMDISSLSTEAKAALLAELVNDTEVAKAAYEAGTPVKKSATRTPAERGPTKKEVRLSIRNEIVSEFGSDYLMYAQMVEDAQAELSDFIAKTFEAYKVRCEKAGASPGKFTWGIADGTAVLSNGATLPWRPGIYQVKDAQEVEEVTTMQQELWEIASTLGDTFTSAELKAAANIDSNVNITADLNAIADKVGDISRPSA